MTTPSPHQSEEWINDIHKEAQLIYNRGVVGSPHETSGIDSAVYRTIHTERQAAKDEILRDIVEKCAFDVNTNSFTIYIGELEGIALRHNITL